jgi:hypothetical protein
MTTKQSDELLPEPPKFSEEELAACKQTGDYRPILFEWYKFSAAIGMVVAHIMPESPVCKKFDPIKYYVLAGLLNRCSRLMLSNVALSHTGKFGETTAIVDRCIFESTVKIRWLCENNETSNFHRYCADGLGAESALRGQILDKIKSRNGVALPIEDRMLASINDHFAAAGLDNVSGLKPLPNLADMVRGLGEEKILYITGQKLGSHHIHGTWPSLLFHYLEERDSAGNFKFGVRGHDCETHTNQYITMPLLLMSAIESYLAFLLYAPAEETFRGLLETTREEILKVADLAWIADDEEPLPIL